MGCNIFGKCFVLSGGRRKMCARHIAFFMFAILCIASSVTCAKDQEQIQIGDQAYNPGEIIADFMDAAFSANLWNQDVVHPEGEGYTKILDSWWRSDNWKPDNGETSKHYQDTKQHAPWFADFMFRPNGWPRHDSINKWNRDISVAIGWPRYNPSTAKPLSIEQSIYEWKEGRRIYPLIQQTVETILPEIEMATGLKTRFLAPEDPFENTENYARIRIIPVKALSPRSVTAVGSRVWEPTLQETSLWGGTLFESSNSSEMDGYSLSNPDNSLGLAVCKINMNLEASFIEDLIAECLVRAMGLPSMSSVEDASLLKDWHRQHEVNEDDKSDDAADGSQAIYFTQLPHYDRFMMQLLYCKKIEPGMDKYQVLQTLMSDDECFSQAKK